MFIIKIEYTHQIYTSNIHIKYTHQIRKNEHQTVSRALHR